MRSARAAIAVVLAVGSVRVAPGQEPAPETGVYAAVLAKIHEGRHPDTVVVAESTLAFRLYDGFTPALLQRQDSIPAPLIERLMAASVRRTPTAALPLPRPLHVLTKAEFAEIFRGGPGVGWEEFYRRFPVARLYFALSPVVLSADGAQALVYFERHCGGLCGEGTLVWLRRVPGGAWAVRRTRTFWVS
jgi:hypothetical protein